MPRKIVALDIDDVIADSTEALRITVNKRYSVNLTPEDYLLHDDGGYWGYYERVWEAHGLHHANLDDLDEDMVIDQSHVPLLPGASFAIGELSKRFDIILVTARDPTWERATLEWITGHFGKVFTSVYFAGRTKNDNDKTVSKGELCKQLGASVLIDDNPAHCRSALDVGIDAILFGDYGWHTDVTLKIKTCKDWPSVLEYFNGRD